MLDTQLNQMFSLHLRMMNVPIPIQPSQVTSGYMSMSTGRHSRDSPCTPALLTICYPCVIILSLLTYIFVVAGIVLIILYLVSSSLYQWAAIGFALLGFGIIFIIYLACCAGKQCFCAAAFCPICVKPPLTMEEARQLNQQANCMILQGVQSIDVKMQIELAIDGVLQNRGANMNPVVGTQQQAQLPIQQVQTVPVVGGNRTEVVM